MIKSKKSGVIRLVLLALILVQCFHPDEKATETQIEIWFMNVGQGDGIIIHSHNTETTLLIDGGSEKSILTDFLKDRNWDTIHTCIITHPDFDHFGAVSQAIDELKIGKMILPVHADSGYPWQLLLSRIKEKQIPIDSLKMGMDSAYIGPFNIECLWPPWSANLSQNESSTVIRLKSSDLSILLTGDIEAKSEQTILNLGLPIESDILKVPHHGSQTSSLPNFIAKVNPYYAVISSDSSVYGHPHVQTIASLVSVMRDSSRILRTQIEGHIGFGIGSNGLERIF